MYRKKFFAAALSALLSLSVLFTACSGNDTSETKTETVKETESETESISETEEMAEAYDTGNPETGLVYFIQPEIRQYDEYDDWHLADWECRDTDVKHEYHYDSEWNYTKELVFVFSNYTDEPITVDSIQINKDDGEVMKFANGETALDIDFTVQPMHKTDYLLKAEDFDYAACESGIYHTAASFGQESYGGTFFIDNSELHGETLKAIFIPEGVDPENWYGKEHTGIAPVFLTEDQQVIFAKACARMYEFFWFDGYLPEDYAKEHTADDFIGLFTDVFTEDFVRQLSQGRYIDENGELIAANGGRGGDISYFDRCFFPVSSDDEQVTFKAVVVHCHGDNPYEIWFDEKNYRMINTENGWRVDLFEVWN